MTQKSLALTESELDRCLRLFGPPPVLSTENAEHFNALLDGIIKSLKLRDLVELTLVRQAVCAQWLIDRYTRHGTIAIERRYQETCKYQALRAKHRQQAAERQEQTQARNSVQNPPDVARLAGLAANVQNLVEAMPSSSRPRTNAITTGPWNKQSRSRNGSIRW